jgi:hypothetical protein
MKRLLMVMALAGLAVACSDDNDDDGNTADTGVGKDGGPDAGHADGGLDGGKADGGSIDSAVATIMCGTKTCSGYSPSAALGTFAAACAKDLHDADVCGLSTALIGGVDAGYAAVLEKDAPGAASASCGAFIDMNEPDGGAKGNGKIDTTLLIPALTSTPLPATYPGCCTPKGFCSGDVNMGTVAGMMSNGGFGCMDSKSFFRATPAASMIPCNPTSGMILIDAGVP